MRHPLTHSGPEGIQLWYPMASSTNGFVCRRQSVLQLCVPSQCTPSSKASVLLASKSNRSYYLFSSVWCLYNKQMRGSGYFWGRAKLCRWRRHIDSDKRVETTVSHQRVQGPSGVMWWSSTTVTVELKSFADAEFWWLWEYGNEELIFIMFFWIKDFGFIVLFAFCNSLPASSLCSTTLNFKKTCLGPCCKKHPSLALG